MMRRFLYSLVVVSSAMPAVAFAQGEQGFTYERVIRILFGLVNLLLNLAMVLAVILIIWYGIKMMTAGGSVARYQDAKKSVIWAIIGVAIIFGVNTLLATIQSVILKGSIAG